MISLVQINYEEKWPPLALLYVGSYLINNGFEVKIYDIYPNEIDETVNEIIKDNPIFVGFSVLTGITSFYSCIMADKLKRISPETKIVWGGHHPSLLPSQCLNEEFVDIVCIGEGEETALEIANALNSNTSLKNIKGIGYKKNSKEIVINTSRPREKNIDKYKLNWELIDIKNYIKKSNMQKVISFFSSRGCPFDCGFCSSVEFYERTWRPHSKAYVVENLVYLKDKYGIDTVYFSDDNFMANKTRGIEILEELYKNNIKTETLDIRIDMLNKQLMDELTRIDVSGIFLGWESGDDRMLELMNKRITSNDIIKVVQLLKKYPSVGVWASGIMCIPTETPESFKNTLNMASYIFENVPKGTVSLFRYMPLPKTKLLNLAIKNGFSYPNNTKDWVRVDPQTNYYDITWIPWLDKSHKQNILNTQFYTRNILRKYGKEGIKYKIQDIFNYIGEWRIKNQNFNLLFDKEIYSLISKYK